MCYLYSCLIFVVWPASGLNLLVVEAIVRWCAQRSPGVSVCPHIGSVPGSSRELLPSIDVRVHIRASSIPMRPTCSISGKPESTMVSVLFVRPGIYSKGTRNDAIPKLCNGTEQKSLEALSGQVLPYSRFTP